MFPQLHLAGASLDMYRAPFLSILWRAGEAAQSMAKFNEQAP